VPKRSEGESRTPIQGVRHDIEIYKEDFPMKWHVKALYYKALYIVVVVASLVAAAAADYKWR